MLLSKIKLLLAAAVTTGLITLAPAAGAGEGGIAGSASFKLDAATGFVTDSSVAVAIGKSSAYAGATTRDGITEAFAAGAAGELTLSGNSIYIQSISADTNDGLAVAQENTIGSDININVIGGTIELSNP